MSEQEKLVLLKNLVGAVGTDEDNLLKAYLSVAASAILGKLYPFHDDETQVPSRYAVKQCEIAQYLYNKQGAEGEVSHDENGIKRTYENGGIPASMLKGIVPYGKVIV